MHPYCRNAGHFGHVHVLRKVIAKVHYFALIIALARAYAPNYSNVRLLCLHRAYLFAHGVCALELAFKRVHMLKIRLYPQLHKPVKPVFFGGFRIGYERHAHFRQRAQHFLHARQKVQMAFPDGIEHVERGP